MKFIIHLTVVDRIINFITVQFNMFYTLKTYQQEVSTSMIKTNHLNWYIIVFADEISNFITNYELRF